MRFLKNWFTALEHPRAPLLAGVLVPVLLGLLSVRLGQDVNWDLQNYHWYNPYALLHGRVDADMAPGGWQSYFNPTIDLPYYLLMNALPAPLVGFVMGFVHGLNFLLVYAIARRVPGVGQRLALLLAAAGLCSVGFLGQLGNTMGDNLTSLLVLSSICLVLRAWPGRGPALVLLAGLLMGLGAGLKLTNATYAVAVCLALLATPVPLLRRLGIAFVYGCGVLAGLMASAGYWWLTMWKQFGNPLFPQFNQIFRSPLAQQLGVIDTFHLPQSAVEALLWPYIIMRDYQRVSEIAIRPAILPVLYTAAFVFAAVWLFQRVTRNGTDKARLAPQACFLLVFGLVAYLAWIKLFSIYRYLVPFELLAPLMLWVLVARIAPSRHAARIGGGLLAATSLAVFPFATWGHANWSAAGISAQFPALAQPASTVVFTGHGDPPMGWLSSFVPRDVRVVSLTGGFPESPAYVDRIQALVASRPGPHFAMIAATKREQKPGPAMIVDGRRCGRKAQLWRRVRSVFSGKASTEAGHACTPRPQDPQPQPQLQPDNRPDPAAERNHALFVTARDNLARYGLEVDEAGCKEYPAAIGAEAMPFRLCPVTRRQSVPAGS